MKKSIVIVSIILMAILPALMGAAQSKAVEYKSTYRGIQTKPVCGIVTTTTTPNTTFQSTSAYSGQWNQDAQQSMLNADGSVNADVYGIGRQNAPGMRKDLSGGINPPDENDDDETENGTPLGDILWPLMLMAMMYAAVRVFRRKPESR